MKNLLVINAALGGEHGNTAELIKKITQPYEVIHLREINNYQPVIEKILQAQAVLFCTGTYWDSWSHHMQILLQEMTQIECHTNVVGKPAGVLVTMHSVGGKSVVSRLQGILNTMGFLIPPMSAMVYALSTHLAQQSKSEFADDFWSQDDLQIMIHNLLTTSNQTQNFKKWPIDNKNPNRRWL